MKRIIIIGHFDWNGNSVSGAIAKVRQVYDELCNQYGSTQCSTVDIFNWRENKLSVFCKILGAFFYGTNIVFVGSDTGSILMNGFSILQKLFHCKFNYLVVGAEIGNTLKKYPERVKQLSFVNCFFVETQDCVDQLKKLGIHNAKILLNFKRLTPIKETEIQSEWGEPYSFCTFSRVNKDKGITDAILAIEYVNKRHGKQLCKLDIFGPIEKEYVTELSNLLSSNCSSRYCGVINNNESVQILKDYFCMLFPTKYYTEGIPGTILDGFAAGLPTICSDWPRRELVIEDNYNGIVYAFDSFQGLCDAIEGVLTNKGVYSDMRINALKSFEKYDPKCAIRPLVAEIE